MLILNDKLLKAEKGLQTRFYQVKYLPLGTISAFFIENANVGVMIFQLLNVVI